MKKKKKNTKAKPYGPSPRLTNEEIGMESTSGNSDKDNSLSWLRVPGMPEDVRLPGEDAPTFKKEKSGQKAAQEQAKSDKVISEIVGPVAPSPSRSSGSGVGYLKGGTSSPKKLNTSTSIVDFLKSTGAPSSYADRKAKANELGISDYRGTADQNVSMLRKLKSGPSSAPSEPPVRKDETLPPIRDEYSLPEEEVALNENTILEQNRDMVSKEDIADGSWDSYMAYLNRLQKRRDLQTETYPNFAEYMALAEDI